MTDETGLGGQQPSAREQLDDAFPGAPVPPAPLPLPVGADAPDRKRKNGLLIAGAATALVVALGLGSYFLGQWLTSGTGSPFGLYPEVPDAPYAVRQAPVNVYWSGNGAYIVAQTIDKDDVPAVQVFDTSGKSVGYLRGYRVVDVEPHAPRIWVVPDERVLASGTSWEATGDLLLDYAGDGVDGRPGELMSFRFLEDEEPRADVDARWTRWDGPGDYFASLEIDVNAGAVPATIRFGDRANHLNVWKAKVPTDVVTFEPVGWSPSGRYLAVLSQLSSAEASKALAAHRQELEKDQAGTLGTLPEATCTIVIVDASNGAVAARADLTTVLYAQMSGARAAWQAGDVLSFLDLRSGAPTVFDLKPGGTPANPRTVKGWEEIPDAPASIVGDDHTSTLIVARSADSYETLDLWRAGSQEATQTRTLLGNDAARFDGVGGMLTLMSSMGEGGSGWTVFVSDPDGGRRRGIVDIEAIYPDEESAD